MLLNVAVLKRIMPHFLPITEVNTKDISFKDSHIGIPHNKRYNHIFYTSNGWY